MRCATRTGPSAQGRGSVGRAAQRGTKRFGPPPAQGTRSHRALAFRAAVRPAGLGCRPERDGGPSLGRIEPCSRPEEGESSAASDRGGGCDRAGSGRGKHLLLRPAHTRPRWRTDALAQVAEVVDRGRHETRRVLCWRKRPALWGPYDGSAMLSAPAHREAARGVAPLLAVGLWQTPNPIASTTTAAAHVRERLGAVSVIPAKRGAQGDMAAGKGHRGRMRVAFSEPIVSAAGTGRERVFGGKAQEAVGTGTGPEPRETQRIRGLLCWG